MVYLEAARCTLHTSRNDQSASERYLLNRIAMLAFFCPLIFALVLFRASDSQRMLFNGGDNPNVTGQESAASSSNQIANDDPSSPEGLAGIASVIDGDTLDVAGSRIRLYGIDAPEAGQLCSANGATYECGDASTSYLTNILGQSEVACVTQDTDRYGRTIATCSVNGSDIGALMVTSGWALAYRRYDDVYIPYETEAKNARRGMWRGEFIKPALWRSGERL